MTVDVVVTVHDALDYVRLCLEALRHQADGCDLRPIVVNDASGAAATDWLRQLARSWPELRLIEQQENLGYTRAVNAGLRASSAAWVVILNSDTVVTSGWLSALLKCAESDASIGLVGPLSNAASWQSVPIVRDAAGGFLVNELPAGMSPNDMARLVASVAQRSYPRVALLNGFCILLRRAVLDRVGLMDEAAFARGYGEENDYCLRAAAAGFALAVADDAYVFHAKSKSFGHQQRVSLTRLGARAVEAKHGKERVRELAVSVEQSAALCAIREAVRCALTRYSHEAGLAPASTLRVLFLLPVLGQSGGANSVVQEAAQLARLGISVKVGVPQRSLAELRAVYAEVPGVAELLLAAPLENLVSLAHAYDVVIGTAYYTMEWLARLVQAGLGFVPAYYVQDYEPWFYAPGSLEQQAAAASYARVPGALLFAKTGFLLRTLQQEQGLHVEKVQPGLDHATFYPAAGEAELPGAALRVTAMVRPQTPRRGAARTMRVLRELALRYPGKLELNLFGCETADRRFQELERDFSFVNHGILRRPAVAALLRRSDLFLDLSDYQAFGRTALEAMACGCVPVLPVAGGADEFASDGVNALVVDSSDESACLERISALVARPEQLPALREAALDTASRFSLDGAARSELQVLRQAVRAQRSGRDQAPRRRLALVATSATLAGAGALGGWKLPTLQHAWLVEEQPTLPAPGSADVAVVLLRPADTGWELFASWLEQWRRARARLVVHLELSDQAALAGAKLRAALTWLGQAADAISVSSPSEQAQLAALGCRAALVPAALDPIVWRVGPAARRNADRRGHDDVIRIGYLGGSVPPESWLELRAALDEIGRSYGRRVALESCSAARAARLPGRARCVPSLESSGALADWLFEQARWDVVLAPVSSQPVEAGAFEARILQYWALGAAIVALDHPVARACLRPQTALLVDGSRASWAAAVASLVDSRALREELVAAGRHELEQHAERADAAGAALDVLGRLAGSPAPRVPELARPLRGLVGGLLPALRPRYVAAAPYGAVDAPRSKLKRKLDKLRRDPSAFFRDARLRPLRLVKGWFQ